MRSPGPPIETLIFGQLADAGENAAGFDPEAVFGGSYDLVEVLEQLLAAYAAAGLADKASSIEKLTDLIAPLGLESDFDHIGVQILAIAEGREIVGSVHDPFTQAEAGGVKHLLPGSSHHHRIGPAFDADQERFFSDQFVKSAPTDPFLATGHRIGSGSFFATAQMPLLRDKDAGPPSFEKGLAFIGSCSCGPCFAPLPAEGAGSEPRRASSPRRTAKGTRRSRFRI